MSEKKEKPPFLLCRYRMKAKKLVGIVSGSDEDDDHEKSLKVLIINVTFERVSIIIDQKELLMQMHLSSKHLEKD